MKGRKTGKMFNKMAAHVTRLMREFGQAAVTYALILALIAVAGIGAVALLDTNVNDTMDRAERRIENTDLGSDDTYIQVDLRAEMSVTVEDFTGTFDLTPHTGSITVNDPVTGYSILYGTSEGNYTSSSILAYTDAGNYTVYFEISADGYKEYYGSFDIVIAPRYVSIPSAYGNFTYDGTLMSATIDNYSSAYCETSGTASATNAGTYTVVFSLVDTVNTSWSDGTKVAKSYNWTIAKRNLNTVSVADVEDQYCTGDEIKPEPAVTYGSRTLVKGTDFTYSYNNNVNAGTATIIVTATADGNWTGYKTKTFKILSKDMTVTSSNYTGTYDAKAHTGAVTVTTPSSGYTIYYGNAADSCNSTSPIYRTNAGTQTVYFKVTANNYNDFTGSFTITINKAKIATVPSTTSSYYYTGSAITPTWTNFDASKLTKGGTTSAVDVGAYSTTFTPTANYTWNDGTTTAKSVSWSIVKRNMAVSASDYSGTYDRTAHGGTVKVTTPSSGATVYYGTSASTCNSTSPITRTDAGTTTVYYKVTANTYNDYTGSYTITINKAKIGSVPSTTTSYWHTGSAITPSWTNYDANKMTMGGTSSATNVGTYTTTFTPKANYTWSDGSTAAKSVSWTIKTSTGTSTYTATLSGGDRFGNSMTATYTLEESWSYATNSSTVRITSIRFNYYTSASAAYACAKSTANLNGSTGHNSWPSTSGVQLKVNNGYTNTLLFVSTSDTSVTLPFNGSSQCYLTYNGSAYSSGRYSVGHDGNGNATVTVYGYFSWGTMSSSATYPRDTRGGIHGGSSGTPASATITLKDTKP